MPKFSALSFADLQSEERVAGRKARKARFVVEVEADDGSWCELDADDKAHARLLAIHWVDIGGARGASCWQTLPSGKLARSSFYKVFEEVNFPEEVYHD